MLQGDPLDDLSHAGEDFYARFVTAALDRRNWGIAKSFFAGSPGGLVDPIVVEQPSRDAPPRGAMRGVGGRESRAPASKRAKRKAAHSARKRNRR